VSPRSNKQISTWSAVNFKKTRDLVEPVTWACNMATYYWSVDTLSWQVSIEHGYPISKGYMVNQGCKSPIFGVWPPFAFVTRRPYCPWRPKKLCFTTQSLAPTVLIARLCVVKQSFFGLSGQYGRRVTKANVARLRRRGRRRIAHEQYR